MIISIGFRKGMFYDIFNTIVSIFTFSKYSHVEIFIDDKSYSATMKDGIRVLHYDRSNHEKYTLIHKEITLEQYHIIMKHYENIQGFKYDYLGIFFNHFIPIKIHNKKRYTCVEYVSEALRKANVIKKNCYTIKQLYRTL